MPSWYRHFVNYAATTCLLLTFGALQPPVATAQQTAPAAASAFSFIAYGDSRPMMNIPSTYGRPEQWTRVARFRTEAYGVDVQVAVLARQGLATGDA